MAIDRAEFVELMLEKGIGCTVNFIPVHLHPYYRKTFGYRPGMFPVAEDAYERMVSLPFHPGMSESDIDRVATAVLEILAECGNDKNVFPCKVASLIPPLAGSA